MPTRFGGVGAWRARRNSAVFLRSRDHGSEDAVVFSAICDDGYFGCIWVAIPPVNLTGIPYSMRTPDLEMTSLYLESSAR